MEKRNEHKSLRSCEVYKQIYRENKPENLNENIETLTYPTVKTIRPPNIQNVSFR